MVHHELIVAEQKKKIQLKAVDATKVDPKREEDKLDCKIKFQDQTQSAVSNRPSSISRSNNKFGEYVKAQTAAYY